MYTRYFLRPDAMLKDSFLRATHGSLPVKAQEMPFVQKLQNPRGLSWEELGAVGKALEEGAWLSVGLYEKKEVEQESGQESGAASITLQPTAKPVRLETANTTLLALGNKAVRFSRFVRLVPQEKGWVLECPAGEYAYSFADAQMAALVFALHTGQSIEQLENMGVEKALLHTLLGFWLQNGVLVQAESPADKESPQVFWEAHDLAFHARSRFGRHAGGAVNPYRFRNQFAPEPLIKKIPSSWNSQIELPNVKSIGEEWNLGFFNVLEARRSCRVFTQKPVPLSLVSALLWYGARIQAYREDALGGISFRPAPSAGALHGLETYIVAGTCENLAGLYWYNPAAHTLVAVPEGQGICTELLAAGKRMAASSSVPPLYMIHTARFKRYQYKYASLAYSVMLKDLGCLQQTLSLVAQALGLGAVILGDTPAEPLASCLGLNYFIEGPVGSLSIGYPANAPS